MVAWIIGAATAFTVQAQPPDLSLYKPFVAKPPYSVLVNGVPRAINVGSVERHYTFAPLTSFVNTTTGQPDMATMLAGDPYQLYGGNGVFWGAGIRAEGVAGRIAIANQRTMIAYRAGDAVVAGKCRTQISSYAVPSRQGVAWQLDVTLGVAELKNGWPQSPAGQHPVAIWEVKAPDAQPALTMVVDTDADDPQSLSLIFGRRGGVATRTTRLGQVNGIKRYERVSIVMEARLDERELANGGQGYWRVWVNGTLAVDSVGPTLSSISNEPHQWYLATYLYQDAAPLQESWVSYWSIARMLVPIGQ